MSNGADVAVIGAGVAGCAAAYYLAREGVKVKIVEREAVGSGASGYAVGVVNPLIGTGVPGPAQLLGEAAFKQHMQLWPLLEDETGVDIQARLVPHLQLCMAEEEAREAQAEMTRWAEAEGFDARWLGADEVRSLEPRVASAVLGAVLLESIGVLDSYRFTLALARAAERHGAEIVHGRVVGLESDGGRLSLTLDSGPIACDAVVVAMGPWSGEASQWLGFQVPVAPLKGQILHLEAPDAPLTYHIEGPGQVLQKADGMVWIGPTEEPAGGFDLTTTDEAREGLMGRALRTMPCLSELSLVQQTACLRPVTPDRLPWVGRAPGWEGVYLATGGEKKGILLGPAMGQAIADLIIRGSTSLPVRPFGVERFLD